MSGIEFHRVSTDIVTVRISESESRYGSSSPTLSACPMALWDSNPGVRRAMFGACRDFCTCLR